MNKSIDKVKLLYKFTDPQKGHEGLKKFYDFYAFNRRKQFDVEMYPVTTNPFRYKYSFKVFPHDGTKELEGAYFVGYIYNGGVGGKPNSKLCVVEFNPNKCDLTVHQNFIYFTGGILQEIKSLDFAIDIPVPPTQVVVIPSTASRMSIGQGLSAPTRYIRYNSRNGRVKVYDKQVERAKQGVEIPPTTRVELTLTPVPLDVWKPNKKLSHRLIDKDVEILTECCNSLNCISYYENAPTDPLLRLLLKSTEEDRNEYISAVTYKTRRKIKTAIRETVTNIEYDPMSLFLDIVSCLKGAKII